MYVERQPVKGLRIFAALLDMIFVWIVSFIISIIFMVMLGYFNYYAEPNSGNEYVNINLITYIFQVLFVFGYYTVFPYLSKGKTLFKMMLGIKVVSTDYSNPTFIQLLIRNIFFFEKLILDGLALVILWQMHEAVNIGSFIGTFLLGLIGTFINLVIFVMILATAEERGLHDMIAGTYVVSKNFDLSQINRANALERKDMEWAEFDDNSAKEDIELLDDDGSKDDIEILE